jgi:hypothetical protein
MKKNIVVGGFSKEQREKELEKIKLKYSKKGYKFLNYIDNGALKSIAIFEVDESILRKEKSIQLIITGGLFLLLALALYIKAS